MAQLTQERCVPCREGAAPATERERAEWLKDIPDWRIDTTGGMPELKRSFKFKDFREALGFTNKIGEIADEYDHHPSILLEWGNVTVRWSTHKIKNLHRNDFIMAANTDVLYEKRK